MNYKKILAFACVIAIFSSSCGTQTATETGENKDIKHTPAEEDILVSTSGTADAMEHINSMDERLKESELIVYGELADFDMQIGPGAPIITTKETIHVIETLYGNVEAASDIPLVELGGYVPVNDYINIFDSKEKREAYRTELFGNLTDEELYTKYISQVPAGYYYPEIGDRAVYCLRLSEDLENIYRKTADWQGKYREIEDGILEKPNISSSISNREAVGVIETITYEELKEQILEAAGKLQEN